MTDLGWTFEKTPQMGGATGEAFTNTLLGTGMSPASVLAREAIQNSVDASDVGAKGKVGVVFRRLSVSASSKKTFVGALGLEGEFAARDKAKVLELQQNHCLASLSNSKEALDLLYVEDFGTHGLFGSPHDSASHFFKLLLSLGDGSKSRTKTGSGGSYGYGKSVYSANSRIRTIVAYSVFDPKRDKSAHHARLMGCSYFSAHEYRGVEYSGRAWFGIPKAGPAQIVDPVHDLEAHRIAAQLGFQKRSLGDLGTSILIVDSAVDCDDLRTSIEDWWWPRMLDDSPGLDVKMFDQEKAVSPPRPRLRPDLRPFIHCYEMAVERSGPLGKQDRANAIKAGEQPLGRYGFTALDEKDHENDLSLQNKAGTIALIRAPRMVVAYMPVGGSMLLPCVGTFVASPEADMPLKISEPAAHDKWDPKSSRLKNYEGDYADLVKSIIDRLKLHLRKFSNEAAPPAPKQDQRLKFLERLLGNLFSPPTKGGGGGGYGADPIEIRFVDQPHIQEASGELSTNGSFRVGLSEEAERNDIEVEVTVECLAVEDEGVSREDPIKLSVTSKRCFPIKRQRFGGSPFPTHEGRQTSISIQD